MTDGSMPSADGERALVLLPDRDSPPETPR